MIDPRGLSFDHWASQTCILISPYGVLPRPTDEKDWKQWANIVVSFPAIIGVNAPRPEGFKNWREWAFRFNLAVQNLGI